MGQRLVKEGLLEQKWPWGSYLPHFGKRVCELPVAQNVDWPSSHPCGSPKALPLEAQKDIWPHPHPPSLALTTDLRGGRGDRRRRGRRWGQATARQVQSDVMLVAADDADEVHPQGHEGVWVLGGQQPVVDLEQREVATAATPTPSRAHLEKALSLPSAATAHSNCPT